MISPVVAPVEEQVADQVADQAGEDDGQHDEQDRLAFVRRDLFVHRRYCPSKSTCTGARDIVLDVEELARRVVERLGQDARRERLDRRVQEPDLVVVVLPRVGDLRLGAGELLLQRQEVRVGLQVGVVLGDGEQLAEPGADGVLRVGLTGDALGALGAAPRLGDLLEGLALVGRVPLDRLDQVGDQVVPAPELHVDLGPTLVGAVPVLHEAVERPDRPQDEQGDDRRSRSSPRGSWSYRSGDEPISRASR